MFPAQMTPAYWGATLLQPITALAPLFGVESNPAAPSVDLILEPIAIDAPSVSLFRVKRRGAPFASDGTPWIFVETAAKGLEDADFPGWVDWQSQAIVAHHPTYRLVVREEGLVGAAPPDWPAVARALEQAVPSGRGATLVLRFDAAGAALACPGAIAGRYARLIVGPVPLWPWPLVGDAAEGAHPMRLLHAAFGEAFGDGLRTWRALSRYTAATLGGVLQRAWRWQESTARAAVPTDWSGQLAAMTCAPALLAGGLASVIADDWAVRAVAAPATDRPLPPLEVLFAAEETADNGSRALDYALDVFGALYPDIEVAFSADGLPMEFETTASKPAKPG